MPRLTLVALLFALPCFQANAQATLNPSQQSALKLLHAKMVSVDAWKTPGASETPLDLLFFVTKDKQVVRKSADGKFQLSSAVGEFSFYTPRDDWQYAIPVTWSPAPKPAAMLYSPERTETDAVTAQFNSVLDSIGAACHVTKTYPTEGLECKTNPYYFLNSLLRIEALVCPAQDGAGCVDFEGRKVLLQRAPKKARNAPASIPANDVISAMLGSTFSNGALVAFDRAGKKVAAPSIHFTTSPGGATFYVITRAEYERENKERFAQWELLGSQSLRETVNRYASMLASEVTKAAAAQDTVQAQHGAAMQTAKRHAALPDKDTALTAIKLAGQDAHAVCTVGAGDTDPVLIPKLQVLATPAFRKWLQYDVKPRFYKVLPNVEALYDAMKHGKCTSAIETASNVAKIANASNSDRAAINVFAQTFGAGAMANLSAQKQGYANDADRKFAEEIGLRGQYNVDRLREVGLGDKAAIDRAMARMNSSGYPAGVSVLQFRHDEIAGAKEKKTARQIHDARIAAQAAERRSGAGLTAEQSARAALARIRGMRDPQERAFSLDNCLQTVRTAERATSDLEKEVTWEAARYTCVSNAPR